MKSIIAVTTLATAAAASRQQGLEAIQRDGLSSDSDMGRHLIANSRQLEAANADDAYNSNYSDMSWVSGYSIKFLGCHSVTQWINEGDYDNDADDEAAYEAYANADSMDPTNGKIESVGLVRFRLCPSTKCIDQFDVGCASHYGEYVASMSTFLEAYLAYEQEMGSNSYDDFDMDSAIQCTQYDYGGEDGYQHYLGPKCSAQGGTITLGLFDDDSCSVPSYRQPIYYQKNNGAPAIPHTSNSIISKRCMSCLATDADAANGDENYYNYDADGNQNYYQAENVNGLCATAYLASGKCESLIDSSSVLYPEEGACTYLEGVKRLKADGIIRGNEAITSKPASIAIGFFTGAACLLGGYVGYLKHKIQKSRVNLAGVTTSLA